MRHDPNLNPNLNPNPDPTPEHMTTTLLSTLFATLPEIVDRSHPWHYRVVVSDEEASDEELLRHLGKELS